MTNDEKVSSLILRIEPDDKSVKRTIAATDLVRKQAQLLDRELQELGTGADLGINNVRSRLSQLASEADRGHQSVEELRRELLELDRVRVEPEIRVKRAGGGVDAADAAGRFGTASSALGGIEGIGSAGGAFGEIGQVFDVIEGTINLVSTLGPAGVAASAGLLLVGSALTQIQKAAEISAAKAQENFNAVAQAADLLAAGASSDQINEVIKLREQEAASIQSQIDRYQPLLDAFDTAKVDEIPGFSRISDDIAALQAIRAEGFGSASDLRAELDRLKIEATGADASLRELNTALADQRTLQADAAAAASEAAQSTIAQAERQRQNFIETQQAFEGTAEAARRQRDALAIQADALRISIIALQQSGDTSDKVTTQIEAYRGQLELLAEDEARLTNVTIPLLEAREKEIALLERGRQFVADVAAGAAQFIGSIADVSKALAENGAALERELAKLAGQRNSDIAKLGERLREDLAEANRRFEQEDEKDQRDRARRLAEFNRDSREAIEDYYAGIQAVERRFTADSRKAVRGLNAVALADAIEAKEQQLAADAEAFEVEQRRRDEDLRELESALDEQDRLREDSQRQQLERLHTNNRRALADVDERYRTEAQRRQAANALAVADLLGFHNLETNLRRTSNNTNLSDLAQYAAAGRRILASMFSGFGAPPNVVIPDVRYITPEEAQREIEEMNRQLSALNATPTASSLRQLNFANTGGLAAAGNLSSFNLPGRGISSVPPVTNSRSISINIGDIVLGDIGNRTDAQVRGMIKETFIQVLKDATG